MKSPQTFNAVVCDGHRYGPNVPPYQSYSMAHRWEVYTSDDGAAWGSPVAAGMWGPDARTALMSFPTRTARYAKVVYVRTAGPDGRDSQDQGGWCAGVDELYLASVEVATH
jgi:hypothetical protein